MVKSRRHSVPNREVSARTFPYFCLGSDASQALEKIGWMDLGMDWKQTGLRGVEELATVCMLSITSFAFGYSYSRA